MTSDIDLDVAALVNVEYLSLWAAVRADGGCMVLLGGCMGIIRKIRFATSSVQLGVGIPELSNGGVGRMPMLPTTNPLFCMIRSAT